MIVSARRSLLSALLPLVALALSACSAPTAPAVVEEPEVRRSNLACVAAGANGSVVVSGPRNGSCPSGFDLQPWW